MRLGAGGAAAHYAYKNLPARSVEQDDSEREVYAPQHEARAEPLQRA